MEYTVKKVSELSGFSEAKLHALKQDNSIYLLWKLGTGNAAFGRS